MLIDTKLLRPLFLGTFSHRIFVAGSFFVICVLTLAASIFWPRVYSSEASIFVEQKNILGRLMEGAAVQTGVQEQARLADDVLFSRLVMSSVLEEHGFMARNPSALEIEKEIENIKDRTKVSVSSPNLITVSYRDRSAERAFVTTKILSEAFVAESARSKLDESNSAYTFIDLQVKEYEEKLRNSEEKLKNFNSKNLSVSPGAENQVRARIGQLRTQISQIEQDLREAAIRLSSLQSQLSGEDRTAEIVAVASSYQTRVAVLKEELDELRLTYREVYPDIVQLKEQIASLETLANSVTVVETNVRSVAAADTSAILQQSLYETEISVATLESRLTEARSELRIERQRMQDIPAIELQLKEINREYNVNQAIYTDLLHRREIARVSMNVDRDQQGLTIRIREPANLPLTAGGPRTYQILLVGLIFGLSLPIGAIGLGQRLDGKIRLASQITENLGIPVIATVPEYLRRRDARAMKFGHVAFIASIILSVVALVSISVLRITGYISI